MEVDKSSAAAAAANASNLELTKDRQEKANAKNAVTGGSIELLFDEDRLRIYYERIFPYKLMFKWISYGKMVQRGSNALSSLDDGTHSTYFH